MCKKITHILLIILSSTCFIISHASSNALQQNPAWRHLPEPTWIVRGTKELGQEFSAFEKYLEYQTPNGETVLLVADEKISDEQLLRAWNILDFYLTDIPGKKYANRTAVADHMAAEGAVLIMPAGADGENWLGDQTLPGQPLYQQEFPIEGSHAYLINDWEQRDAGFEEILHLVHDYGIGTRYTDGVLRDSFQQEVAAAAAQAIQQNIWPLGGYDVKEWLAELTAEGSVSQEYLASVVDSFYGLWGAWEETPGGMWGIYVAKTRAEIQQKDPAGWQLMQDFFPDFISFVARISPEFQGEFSLQFDPLLPYTHKSQYLKNARLTGNLPSGLRGNAADNFFVGNSANNFFDGQGGHDFVQFSGVSSEYEITDERVHDRLGRDGTDTLKDIEVLRFRDRDIFLK